MTFSFTFIETSQQRAYIISHSPHSSISLQVPFPLHAFHPIYKFQASSTSHNIMHRAEQIKPKRLPTSRDGIRSPQTLREKPRPLHPSEQPPSLPYKIVIRQEKPRKGSDKLPTEKLQRPKRLKFITQGIEQSTQELLSLRSRSNLRERSAKLSPHNVEEENAYELLRASKRSHQGQGKFKTNKEEQRTEKRVGNIKLRKEKSHSKDKVMTGNLKLEMASKMGKKTKNGAKSSRKSEKNLHTSKRFLSPQLVKLENSYYFSNRDEESAKTVPLQSLGVPIPSGNTLGVPKKESKFIFESNQDFWNDPQSRRLLTSTVDLLN